MNRIICLLLVEMGLVSFVISSLCISAAFTTTKRNCRYDQKLYSKTSSTDNLIHLQKRFNFTEDWTKKSGVLKLKTLNDSIVDSRIDWLKERLNLNENEVAIILKRVPQILQLRSDEKLGPNLDFLAEALMLKPKELSKLVQMNPSVLILRIRKLQQNLNWIKKRIVDDQSCSESSLKRMNIAKKVVCKAPTLLNLDIDNNLDPKWEMMQERLDLNNTQMAKICIKNPKLLAFNFTTSIEPKLNWLQNRLDLDVKELSKIIQRHPKLFSSSVDNTFEPKLLWLERRLCLDNGAVTKIIVRQPAILYYSTATKIEPVLLWLQERLMLQDPQKLSKLIDKCPRIFDFSIENNLDPTFDFFSDCIGKEEAIRLLQNNPRYLTASLENRLKPRRYEAQRAGIKIDIGCVQRMTVYPDEKWCISLDYQQKRKLNMN